MKASKKLLILSSTLIATSLPIVTSISCTVKTIAQIKYEKMLEKVNKKIDTLLEKMNNNIGKKVNLDKKIRLIINVMSFFIIFKKRGI